MKKYFIRIYIDIFYHSEWNFSSFWLFLSFLSFSPFLFLSLSLPLSFSFSLSSNGSQWQEEWKAPIFSLPLFLSFCLYSILPLWHLVFKMLMPNWCSIHWMRELCQCDFFFIEWGNKVIASLSSPFWSVKTWVNQAIMHEQHTIWMQ